MKALLISFIIALGSIGIAHATTITEIERLQIEMVQVATAHVKSPVMPKSETVGGVVREVTAYNLGDIAQNWGDPCIGAYGDNLCELVDQGIKICAANFVPENTVLTIANYGECIVKDRMNSRYKNRVDIAMRKDEIQRALEFGKQNLYVIVVD